MLHMTAEFRAISFQMGCPKCLSLLQQKYKSLLVCDYGIHENEKFSVQTKASAPALCRFRLQWSASSQTNQLLQGAPLRRRQTTHSRTPGSSRRKTGGKGTETQAKTQLNGDDALFTFDCNTFCTKAFQKIWLVPVHKQLCSDFWMKPRFVLRLVSLCLEGQCVRNKFSNTEHVRFKCMGMSNLSRALWIPHQNAENLDHQLLQKWLRIERFSSHRSYRRFGFLDSGQSDLFQFLKLIANPTNSNGSMLENCCFVIEQNNT